MIKMQNLMHIMLITYVLIKCIVKKELLHKSFKHIDYNQSHLNKNIVVSLFKRENELTGIVPLCVYSTYGFSVNKWSKPINLDAHV